MAGLLFGPRRALLGGRETYLQKVQGIQRANQILYHPMNEPSGGVAIDYSPEGNNGAYTNVTLGEPGIGDGLTCPRFDGVSGYEAPWSAGLASDFDGTEGTFAIWAKVFNAAIWTNAIKEQVMAISADVANNYMNIVTSTVNNRMDVTYEANGVSNARSVIGLLTTGWMHWSLTWSVIADELKVYLDGVQQGATFNGLGTWVGPLINNNTVFGVLRIAAATSFWNGWLAHAVLWKIPLAQPDITNVATV